MKIIRDCAVQFRYNLAPAGEPLTLPDSDEPLLSYLHGHQQIIAGLEQALEGHAAGERFEVELSPEQAYGERDESRIEKVEREAFAGMKDLRAGLLVQINDESGKPALARVIRLDNREVELDLNHPYAGLTLVFSVEVVSVRAATDQELADGRVTE
ncbi:FKBP-type peptidyl-prolyl cis-trans isomerase [Marinobacterium zhoushanense]|nr:peptidylprolyl isomerase [Marinobacterium zhoushanense]